MRLVEALDKLSRQTRQPDFLILVDDGSPLAIPSIIRCAGHWKLNLHMVRTLESSKWLFLALSSACKEATGQFARGAYLHLQRRPALRDTAKRSENGSKKSARPISDGPRLPQCDAGGRSTDSVG